MSIDLWGVHILGVNCAVQVYPPVYTKTYACTLCLRFSVTAGLLDTSYSLLSG